MSPLKKNASRRPGKAVRPSFANVTRAVVDLTAFRHNLDVIRRRLAPGTDMLLVVKSDAYGHGMVPIARAAERQKSVVYFGVATAEEALELRDAGIRKPILLLAPAHPPRLPELVQKNISFSVSSVGEARLLDRVARKAKRRVKIHAEVDTGMGRLGADYTRALDFLFAVHRLSAVEMEGAYTHFPCADQASSATSERQVRIFSMLIELFRELYPGSGVLRYAHAANSAGTFRFANAHFNLVRPGLAAYGVSPVDGVKLKPILSLRTRIAYLKTVEAGTPISYRSTYRTRRRSVIATLPVGYSSGYPLRLSNRARVLIGGRSFPVAGRVTMDQIMVDLGDWRGARLWEEAVLIGEGSGRRSERETGAGHGKITVDELARLADTIPYEILCGIHPKIPRIYTA